MEFYLFYEALICFLDVTFLNLFPSQNRLFVVPVRGEEKSVFTPRIPPDIHGSLGVTNFHKSQQEVEIAIGHTPEEPSGPLHSRDGSHFIAGKVTF